MMEFAPRLGLVAPFFVMAAMGASDVSGQTSENQALALKVTQQGDMVEVELVANSAVAQQVEYEIELVGNSRARTRGDSNVSAGERHVLSRMKTNVSDTWCAKADITESNGAKYVLTAGDC